MAFPNTPTRPKMVSENVLQLKMETVFLVSTSRKNKHTN